MKDYPSNSPFSPLGKHLRFLREQVQESVAEVSGAVEIDIDTLERIEQGKERPSEDILMLLISHFNMQDHEAVQLWELAGYDDSKGDKFSLPSELSGKPMLVLLAMDVRTMYSDGIQVTANQGGVTMHFTQGKGQPVARVGMSREQAEAVLRTLQTVLLQSKYMNGPRLLPPPSDTDQ
jgi:transcriptional regulator with XRE-family HTH domain